MSQEVDPAELKCGSDRFNVLHHRFDGVARGVCQFFRFSGSSLINEDDPA